ncbi:hypothetical protein TWF694_006988 [Orbilia ellipsospora]|uniref:F-box domain-containing protein n=1 Tax=Orbilia ellipsospora TaxID=2528407 RepID=A0AAV9XLT9_9PEZI
MANVQAASIASLPTELIWDILDYLPLRDRVRFLRICKPLHASAYSHLWSRFHLVGYTSPQGYEVRDGSTEEGVGPTGRARLLQLVNELGPDALGFKYIKVMGFERHLFELVGRDAGKDPGNELVRIFASQIEQGKMTLSCAEFAVSPRIERANPRVIDFLIKLRRYTEQKSQEEFSLHLKATSIATVRSDLFDLTKIKRLTLFLDDYYRIDVTVAGTVNYILGLTRVLSVATHLQRLVISGPRYALNAIPQITVMKEPLQQLQDSLSKLKRLRELELEGLIFHPSFFPIPPGNVKKVSLSTVVSMAWWRQFARCPFPEVDELTLYPTHIHASKSSTFEISEASWISDTDEEFSIPGFRNHFFELGDVAVRGLKRFNTANIKKAPCPSDLSICIIRKNKMLEGKVVEQYMDDFREDLDRECQSTFQNAYASCVQSLKFKLEECLEEHIRTNAREYAREVLESPGFDAKRTCNEAIARKFEQEIAPDFVKDYVDKLLKWK